MKTIGTGHIGADAKVHNTSNKKEMLTFSLAEDKSYKDKNGEKVEKTVWHNCIMFATKFSEKQLDVFKKGNQFYIEGDYETSTSTKDGNTYNNANIIVENFKVL